MSAKTVIPKFDNTDRHRVLSKLKDHGVALTKLGRKDRQLVDQAGVLFFLIGGIETWNRLSEDDRMAAAGITKAGRQCELIFCLKNRSTIEVFRGKLIGLELLGGQGDINLVRRGDLLTLRQLPEVRLTKVLEFSHIEDDRQLQKSVDGVRREIGRMSEQEKRELLKDLLASENEKENAN